MPAGGGAAWIDHPELEGDARAGGALDLVFGWVLSPRLSIAVRWPVTDIHSPAGSPLSVEGGVHGHLYDDGSAVVPYATLHLRFYGSTAP